MNNNREAAIAALLRQGWVATSRPVAAARDIPLPASPLEGQQGQREQQEQQEIYELPAAPVHSPNPEPTPAATEPILQPPPLAEDLTSEFTLIDLSDGAPSPDASTSTQEAPTAMSLTTSMPFSSRESLASLVEVSSTGESLRLESLDSPEPESKPGERDEEPLERQSEEAEEETEDEGEEKVANDKEKVKEKREQQAPFTVPVFSTAPPAAISIVIPMSQQDWILCSEVGLQFMRPARERVIACVACGQDVIDDTGAGGDGRSQIVFRSTFWRATTCHAGHQQHGAGVIPAEGPADRSASPKQKGLCSRCDKDYVLQVVRGEHKCSHSGCWRALRVHTRAVEDVLWDHPGLLRAFLGLVQTHNSVYECAIHADEVPFNSETTAPTARCNHDVNACMPCLTLLCESAIRGDRLNDLVCPEPLCRQQLERETIRQLVSADSLKLYDKKLAFAAMSRNPNFRWCRCGHGQIHEPGETNPEWLCMVCNARHCFICRDDEEVGGEGPGSRSATDRCDHLRRIDSQRALGRLRVEHERGRRAGAALQQRRLARQAAHQLALQARENTAGTQLVIATTAKRCPRLGCRVPIQRDAGCAHMTCRNCRTQFCWACKVIWRMPPRATGAGDASAPAVPLHLTTCPLVAHRRIDRRHLNTAGYADRWDVDRGYDLDLDAGLWLVDNQR